MKYLQDYKGKHFVLADRPDEYFGDRGTIEDEKLTDEFLENHIDACMYFGIPPYIGKDEKLKKRIEITSKRIIKEINKSVMNPQGNPKQS